MQFAYELQKAGKPFELMLYPKSRHGVTDPPLVKHLRELMLDFTLRTLRPETGGSRQLPEPTTQGEGRRTGTNVMPLRRIRAIPRPSTLAPIIQVPPLPLRRTLMVRSV